MTDLYGASEIAKKGLSSVHQLGKRIIEGMASDPLRSEITSVSTHTRVEYCIVERPIHQVGLNHPMTLQAGGGSFTARMRRKSVGEDSEQMQGITWQRDHHPSQDVESQRDRYGHREEERWEELPPDVRHEDQHRANFRESHGDQRRDDYREDYQEQISQEQRDNEVHISTGNTEILREGPSAKVTSVSDIEKIDSQYLNMGKKELIENRDHSIERGPPQPRPSQNDLRIEIAALHESLKVLQDTLEMQTRESNREKNELKGKLGQYMRKTQQLHQIIIKNTNQTTEPSDSDIERTTTEISSDITRIIRTHYAGSKLLIDMSKARQYKTEEFYKALKVRSPETVRRLLSQRLFRFLNDEIFSTKVYGLDSSAEYHLEKFERAIMSSPKIKRQDAEEWRIRTVSCATQLDLPLEKRVQQIAEYIWQHFCAMELSGPKKNTQSAVNDMKDALHNLCEKSLKLALKFRATGTRYYFQVPSECTYLSMYPSENYQIMGSEGEMSKEAEADPQRQRVYCTLFGALIKTRDATATEEEKSVTLFQAQVITYEDSRDRGS